MVIFLGGGTPPQLAPFVAIAVVAVVAVDVIVKPPLKTPPEIIKTAIPHVPMIGKDNHSNCPQTSYRNKQKKTTNQRHHSKQNVYTVPVNNKFDILGN